MAIRDIADACGFGSISLFSRSFRAYFNTTAKAFRQREKAVFAKDGLRYSKNGQLLSKNLKHEFDFNSHLCTFKLKELVFMDTKIEIKEMPEKVRQDACITLSGDVKTEGEIGKAIIPGGKHVVGRFQIDVTGFEKAWSTVCLWITESGYQPFGNPYELYYNSAEDEAKGLFDLEICIPVKPL